MIFSEKRKSFQKIGLFLLLLFFCFFESALGYFPVFFGTAPKILLTLSYVMLIRDSDSVPLYALVFIGLVYDILQANPLGYTSAAMVIICVFVLVRNLRLPKAELAGQWLNFAFLMGIILAYSALVIGLYNTDFLPLRPLTFQFSATVLLFPVIYHVNRMVIHLGEVFQRLA